MPRFSVVVPCYNDGRFLDRSIGSVRAQSFSDWEVVLVNDGSDDQTEQVANAFAGSLGDQFHYIYQPNQGVSSARNAGVDAAGGAWIVFLDADDELSPDALAHYAQASGDWLIGGFDIERDGRVKRRVPVLPRGRKQRFADYLEKKIHLGNVSNMCFSRAVFEEIRFDPQLLVGEDTALFSILLTRYDPVLLSDITATAHRRPDSLRTRSSLRDMIESKAPLAIFEHPLLAQEYRAYANLYLARRGRSIMKRAFRDGDYASAVKWYGIMIQENPGMLLNLKLLGRYLTARRRMA